MNGLTSTGFQIDSLSQNITSIEQQYKAAYNNPSFSVEDNEYIGQQIKVLASRETKAWQAIQQIYNAWTINGAEGPFLDELFALNGVFRKGATSGVGDAVVQTDSLATDTTEITAGTIFNGTNGVQYVTSQTYTVPSRVTGYRLLGNTIPLGTYNFTIINKVTNVVFTQSITLASTTPTARLNFLNTLQTYLQSVNPVESDIYLDTNGLVLYYGFNEAFALVGLEQTVEFKVTPSLGNRYALVECVASKTGFRPLLAGEITAMSPLPQGYVSVTNLTKFSDGTDVETDAAFIERARQETDKPRSSTKTAIIAGLLGNVVGLEQVRIDKVINGADVTLNPILIGGETQDIAVELERTQPINNVYSGNTSFIVDTADGTPEEIFFTRGVTQRLSVRVTYKTVKDNSLSVEEQTKATGNLLDTSEVWRLGDKIFNFSLLSAVSAAVEYGRFSSLLVEVKRLEQPDSAYSSLDFVPATDELPILLTEDVKYVRV